MHGQSGAADTFGNAMPGMGLGFQYRIQRYHWHVTFRPIRNLSIGLTCDQNAFTFLRKSKIRRIQDSPIDGVAHCFQRSDNASRRFSALRGGKLPDILDYDNGRTFYCGDTRNFQKQIAP